MVIDSVLAVGAPFAIHASRSVNSIRHRPARFEPRNVPGGERAPDRALVQTGDSCGACRRQQDVPDGGGRTRGCSRIEGEGKSIECNGVSDDLVEDGGADGRRAHRFPRPVAPGGITILLSMTAGSQRDDTRRRRGCRVPRSSRRRDVPRTCTAAAQRGAQSARTVSVRFRHQHASPRQAVRFGASLRPVCAPHHVCTRRCSTASHADDERATRRRRGTARRGRRALVCRREVVTLRRGMRRCTSAPAVACGRCGRRRPRTPARSRARPPLLIGLASVGDAVVVGVVGLLAFFFGGT